MMSSLYPDPPGLQRRYVQYEWKSTGCVSVQFKLAPGSPRTATEPATADEVEIIEVWRGSENIDGVIGALEDAGCNIYETLQERILESRCWEDEG